MANGTSVSAPADRSQYDVSLSKTIAPTGTENLFNVTVNAQYKQANTVTTSKDAAVVLVLDTSTSMKGKDSGQTKTRLQLAQDAAKTFLTNYQANGSGSKRYVAIVYYSDVANTQKIGTAKVYWVDVAQPGMLDSAKTAIDGITTGTYTNTQAGLLLANNLLTNSGVNSAVKNISNKFVVLLTDGVPTKRCDNAWYVDTTGVNQVPSDWSDTTTANTTHSDQSTTRTVQDACATLQSTSGAKAAIYGITYNIKDTVKTDNGNQEVNTWLTNDCHMAGVYSVSDSTSLKTAFDAILNESNQTGSAASAVADPMDANVSAPNPGFLQFVQFTGNSLTAQTNGEAQCVNNSVSWGFSGNTKDTDPATGWSSYTLTYQVRLNTVASGFLSNHVDIYHIRAGELRSDLRRRCHTGRVTAEDLYGKRVFSRKGGQQSTGLLILIAQSLGGYQLRAGIARAKL